MAALADAETVFAIPALHGGSARVLAGQASGLDLFVLDAPHLFDRPGNPYMDANRIDWPDNPRRFAALARVAADIGLGAVPGWVPGAVHCHDWQTGLAPAYLAFAGGARPPHRDDHPQPNRSPARSRWRSGETSASPPKPSAPTASSSTKRSG